MPVSRWSTCCSTVESDRQTEYLTGQDRLFADDPETGKTVVRRNWYEPTRRSVDHHLEGGERITAGSDFPIVFSLRSYSMG